MTNTITITISITITITINTTTTTILLRFRRGIQYYYVHVVMCSYIICRLLPFFIIIISLSLLNALECFRLFIHIIMTTNYGSLSPQHLGI